MPLINRKSSHLADGHPEQADCYEKNVLSALPHTGLYRPHAPSARGMRTLFSGLSGTCPLCVPAGLLAVEPSDESADPWEEDAEPAVARHRPPSEAEDEPSHGIAMIG